MPPYPNTQLENTSSEMEPEGKRIDNPLLQDKSTSAEKKSATIETVEQLYAALGNPGRFATIVFLVTSLNMLTVATNHAAGVFLDYSPTHTCHALSKNITRANGVSQANSSYLPNDLVVYSECTTTYMSEGSGNVTRPCKRGQWTYKVYEQESSSITEWDLVCDRASLAYLSSTLYYVGVMLGGLVFGFVSDLVGRRRAVLVSLYLSVGLGLGIAFSHDLVMYIVLRALMGFAIQGLLTVTYIRMLEVFGPRFRGFSGNALYCVWGISLNYLGMVAWILKNWRYIQLACIAQGAVGLFYLWLMPESLRWLIAKGKVDEATRLTDKIYRLNGCTDKRCLDPYLLPRLTAGKGKDEKSTTSITDLFKASSLRRRTCILGYVTLAVNFGYWGLTYNTQALVGNRYQNFIISACPETFVYLINVYILHRFGRKRPMMFYFSVTALCCFISCLISSAGSGSLAIEVTVVSTIGRLAACGLMGTNDVFMAELYPTVVRNTGVGVCICMGRIGAVITPIIFTLTPHTFQGFPLLSFGIVTFGGVIFVMLLPDTWKQDLPETLRDLEMSLQVDPPAEDYLLSEDIKGNKDSTDVSFRPKD